MAGREPSEWSVEDWKWLARGDELPGRLVPRKLVLGSDYFYSTEQAAIDELDRDYAGSPPWSPARGGFSVGWGASALPPAPSDIEDWPITHEDVLSNMREVLHGVGVSEPEDEIGNVFGKLRTTDRTTLQLSDGQKQLLQRLQKIQGVSDKSSTLVGQSRLLTEASRDATNRCRFCGHCSSGCVYGSIYTAEHDIDRWIREDLVVYQGGTTVFSIVEAANSVRVSYVKDSQVKHVEADRIFLAAGAVNTSRILLNSSPHHPTQFSIRATGGVLQLFASPRGLGMSWPKANTQTSHFVELKREELSPFWAHVQIGQPNELILRRLKLNPTSTTTPLGRTTLWLAGRMISAAMNVHSSLGPTYEVLLERNNTGLPRLSSRRSWRPESQRVVNQFGAALRRTMRGTGFYAVPMARQDSVAAHGYHFGASFPMSREPRLPSDTDLLGRPFGWQRVHVVDTSVLPTIPATTVGVLTMANAHRIAKIAVAC